MKFKKIISDLYEQLLSKNAKDRVEKLMFVLAIIGFAVHLIIIGLANTGLIPNTNSSAVLRNPLNAIYTPFSIILFYEIYCIFYYLPRSISIYIGKQFEIIALITIREIFEQLALLNVSEEGNSLYSQPDFLYSLVSILILFGLIYLYYRLNQRKIKIDNITGGEPENVPKKIEDYIFAKKTLALSVGVVFILLVLNSLYQWLSTNNGMFELIISSKPVIKNFFASFYTVLILCDVVILLISFAITDEFHKVMRNSGFVVSTTLMKLSFGVDGLQSHILVLLGVIFGTLMLALYKMYRKIEIPDN
ncbi:hypothetical protein [Petrimonas sp.]|uniref:hypothetical protein n=1 Tax=Petrimonas sp. TaxID=2023866 RepID=UPI003F517406